MVRPARFLFLLLFAWANTLSAQSEVVPGVHLLRGRFTPGSQPDGNSVVLDSSGGLIIIDTGRHAAHTQQLLDFARARSQPVAAVINSHWHLDHIGGNVLIRRDHPNVKVYASAALQDALGGFLANYRKQLAGMLSDAAISAEQKKMFEAETKLIDAGAKLAPDVIIERAGEQTIAGRLLKIGFEANAVTAGDLWVLDPATGVLIAGDLVTLPAPFLDTACPKRWRESLTELSKADFDLLIPGHGALMTRKQFASYQRGFVNLLDCAATDATETTCTDGWIRDVRALMPDLDERFTRTLMAYYIGVLRNQKGDCGQRLSKE
jgi:glyoxylase-like metal-dependent hydrolase (beta-lactamase superfamily II)